jgi:hypothetical protein
MLDIFPDIIRLLGRTGISLIVAGFTLAALSNFRVLYSLVRLDRELGPEIANLLSLICFSLAFSYAAMRYLRGPSLGASPSGKLANDDENHLQRLIEELQEQQRKLETAIRDSSSLAIGSLSDEERHLLLDSLRRSISENLSEDFVNTLEELYGDAIRRLQSYAAVKGEYERTRSRLHVETQNLGRRGNLNLVIGIFISLLGIVFLGWIVVNAPSLQLQDQNFIAYYVPRTTFVVLIEIFAFFFLNLYRTSLSDIKYFQNETTNVEYRILASN